MQVYHHPSWKANYLAYAHCEQMSDAYSRVDALL